MTSLLDQLRARNTRTVHLLQSGDTVTSVPEGTPGAVAFRLARVNARDVRQDILYAALGRDGYVSYATWFNAQAQQALTQAQANSRKPGEAETFDDSLPDDANWRAHSLAVETAVDEELLTRGLILEPHESLAEVLPVLGPFRAALVQELVQWDRRLPDTQDSPSGPSVPP